MSKSYRPDHRGSVFRFFWPLTSYLVTHGTVIFGAIFFFLLNRTTVIGRSNVPRSRNTLLISNHQSLIDSFFVGFACYFGPSFVKPYLIPWNPAGEEFFYQNAWQSWWSDQWKCIPVRRRRRDLSALNRMLHALKSGTMILFPEGTRTRTGDIEKGRPGAGVVILKDRPTVIPVTIDGMNDVLPIDARWPRVFKRVYIVFGKPIDYTALLTDDASREASQQIVDHVMEVVKAQMDWIQELKAGRADRRNPPWT
ncbi:MAG: 1-acyl-sn-glycerol-3-phosphate acyltransferase [Gemmatimonadales bacterium]|nr:MAG: 1-acyl-sn-glycerol-3-phosphate acyltransferase [Gemmatimonadales bacterium]